MSIDSDTLRAFIDATDRQIEAIQKNTEALHDIRTEARIQTLSLHSQQASLEDMKKKFIGRIFGPGRGNVAELLDQPSAESHDIFLRL